MNKTAEKIKSTTYDKIDINLDGKFDELDIEEAARFDDMKVMVLTSSYSFSCGNLFPSLMKELGFKIIGEKSGGGSCAIMFNSTADGSLFIRSSYYCLSDNQGHNIDSGVEVDLNLVNKTVDKYGIEREDFSLFFEPSNILSLLNQE